MEECMKKLALWYTRNFKPIMTHDELEPIMSTIGFLGLQPAAGYKEYVFPCGRLLPSPLTAPPETTPPPKPRLPYPHIDGLHINTYQAFLKAVEFYLVFRDISDIFHVRGMALHRGSDKSRKWRRMEEDESVFVYRDGTLEQSINNSCHPTKLDDSLISQILIQDRHKNAPASFTLLPLKDIILWK